MRFFEMNLMEATPMSTERVGSAKNALVMMLAAVERQLMAGRTTEGETSQAAMAGLRREQGKYMAQLMGQK